MTKPTTPGRTLTQELQEPQPDGAEGTVEAAPAIAAKSIFELPRRESKRMPVFNADNVTTSSDALPAYDPATEPDRD
jgi:hypothetical protein